MEEKIYKHLLISYYAAFLLFFAVFFVCFAIVRSYHFDFSQNVRIALQSVGIMYVLASVPFALWYFHRTTLKIKNKEEVLKAKKYENTALIRIFLIAFGVILNVTFYCFLQDKSMFYCAVIAALAFIFCKPQKNKIVQDLSDDVEQNEEE